MTLGLLLALSAHAAPAPAEQAIDHARLRGLDARIELSPRTFSFAGGHRVRLDAEVHGLPVRGFAPVVSLDDEGRVARDDANPVSVPPPPVASSVDPPAAIAAADGVLLQLGTGELWEPRARRVWLHEAGALTLAWEVDASTAAPPATWRVWIDAADGSVLRTARTSHTADGHVYPTNPVRSDLARVALRNLVSDTQLDGVWAEARSCDDPEIGETLFDPTVCHARSPHALPDGDGHYLFDPDPGSVDDPLAEVHAYHHTDRIAQHLFDRFGFELPYGPIVTTVNFPMANAFFGDFDGDGAPDISFGHADEVGVDLGYDADVVYHEFGHAIVSELAPGLPFVQADVWGIEWVSGSLNEGAADIWAMLLTADPAVGEYAGSAFERDAIRDLAAPRRCPDDLRGEVHRDGEILGALGWRWITDPRLGPDATGELLFGATPLFGTDPSWKKVGEALALTADDLRASGFLDDAGHAAVLEGLEASNLLDCGRSIPLDDGRELDMYVPTLGVQGDLERLPMGTQFTLDVPEDAAAIRFVVHEVVGPEGMGWSLRGTVGERVRHDYTEIEALGLGFAVPVDSDWVVDGAGADVVELTADGEPGFTPGETLYLAMSSRNLGSLVPFDLQFGRILLSAEVIPAADTTEVPAGCACAGSPWGSATPSGLIGLLWLARRRRLG